MLPTETRRLALGSATIEYALRRSTRRRKTVEIVVDPVDGVRVAAPASASQARLDEMIKRRAHWILKRLEQTRNSEHAPPKRELVNGEAFDYLGRQYRLRLVNANAPERARPRLVRGWLEVITPPAKDEPTKHRHMIRALERWYRIHAESKLRQRVQLYAQRIGVQPGAVLVRVQERRWGSCGANKTLRFNWRIIMAPLSVVDYVVVHELCHIRHADHSRAFWNLLANVLPDYELRRERLRRDGAHYRL